MSGEVSWMQAVCAGTRAPATDEVAGVRGRLHQSSWGFQGRLMRLMGRGFMTAEFLLESPSSGSLIPQESSWKTRAREGSAAAPCQPDSWPCTAGVHTHCSLDAIS
ncbi:hypothetical protein EGK_14373 [Macaca mulatta]|uniref:Uncharacterized protein n=1 Tax=Macaca mulatta TaxID=9544 RepID=G7MNJ1_MACMU|nr:hypothetical protein EGK_14373 [Macaca mulatta]